VKVDLSRRIVASRKIRYATGEDFFRLFLNDVERPYLLSYLLTANHVKAEECFAASFDDCVDGIAVFQEWVDAWARRVIVRKAVRLMRSSPSDPGPRKCTFYAADKSSFPGIALCGDCLAKFLALEDFERFVFVLSVLEGYPDHSCAILLGTARQEIGATRVCALNHVAGFATEGTVRATKPMIHA